MCSLKKHLLLKKKRGQVFRILGVPATVANVNDFWPTKRVGSNIKKGGEEGGGGKGGIQTVLNSSKSSFMKVPSFLTVSSVHSLRAMCANTRESARSKEGHINI